MKRFVKILDSVCVKAVCLISFLIFGALSYWALFYTHYFGSDLSSEKVYAARDLVFYNLLFTAGVLIVTWLLQRLVLRGQEEQKRRLVRKITAAAVAVIGICLMVWVSVCHITPEADQLQVIYTAREFMDGNFQQMREYMYMCPHQYGLTFFYEFLLRISDSYRFLQYLNAVFVMMIVGFGCLITEELFHNQTVNLYCLLGFICFFPLLLYVNFVYGEICSVAMIFTGTWCLLKWISGGKIRYVFPALLCMSAAVLVRKNSLIFLIAVFITLMLYGIVHRSGKAAVLAVLAIAVPLLSIEAVQYSYEKRSGYEVGEGIPASMYIAMGMQECWNGAGAFNGFNHSVFWGEAEGDTQAASKIGWAYVRGRIKEFMLDPQSARYFYRDKLLQQWNEPTYGSLIMTSRFDWEPAPIVRKLYFGELQDKLTTFMDRYLFLLYLMAAVWAVTAFFRKPDILECLMMITVIGGVLFSLLWEAKSRYVFPYAVLLIPYMAYGIYLAQKACGILIGLCAGRWKKHGKRQEEAA